MPAVLRPSPTWMPRAHARDSVRPPAFREGDFEQEHDSTTLFYDTFWYGSEILMLGPPLNNLAASFADMRVIALPSGTSCSSRTRVLELHHQVWVTAPEGTEQLILHTGAGDIVVPVRPPEPSAFAGLRVLCTMSKDNELVWIEDWVRFHRDIHGAEAVLVYDNASTAYSAEQLQERLEKLDGIVAAQVVDWPFKYGPQGYKALGYWDSAYSQPGVFEHARWSSLADARSVMNGDVDELVHSPRGSRLFETVESSRFGVLRYNGLWMPTTDRATLAAHLPPRHRDFQYYTTPRVEWNRRPPRRGFSAPKWAVVPRRSPSGSQWQVHRVKRWPAAALITPEFRYRHYRRLSTGWKYDRGDVQPFDPAVHTHDATVVRDYEMVRWDR